MPFVDFTVVVHAVCLILISNPQKVYGDGKLQLRMSRYDNPSGKGNNGHCCDGRLIFCETRGCDYYFQMCLGSFHGSDSMTSCSIGQYTTGSTQNEDSIQFGSSIGGTANPYEISFRRWNTGVKIKVQVWDYDPRTGDDFVDSLLTRVTVGAAASQSAARWMPFVIRARTSLTGMLRVFCSPRYYGPSCDVYCGLSTQYVCDANGEKVCRPGWTGSDCSTAADACSSNPCENGAQCHSEADHYVCTCLPGFTGRNCESKTSDCAVDTCRNGGVCWMTNNATHYCECPAQWTGDHCETKLVRPSCESEMCLNNATCVDDETGFVCVCNYPFTGELCEVSLDDSFTNDNVTDDVIDDDDSLNPNSAEKVFIFDGRLEPDDAQQLAVAISNQTKLHLHQLDCDHVTSVHYRLEYCTGKSGNNVSLFFYDVTCNSSQLSWSALEKIFNSMSSDNFHRMLPLELSEEDDCVPNTRASSDTLRTTTVAAWIVPTVISSIVVLLLILIAFFVVYRYRRRRMSMPMSYDQPTYIYNEELSVEYRQQHNGRNAIAPHLPAGSFMGSGDDYQPLRL